MIKVQNIIGTVINVQDIIGTVINAWDCDRSAQTVQPLEYKVLMKEGWSHFDQM